MREVAVYVLRQHGYNVMAAQDGFDALQILKNFGQQTLHALITDLVMPKMNGRELAKRVIDLHPETKVLYTSGYTDEINIKHEIAVDKVPYLQKPFTAERLASKIRAVLDS